MLERAAHNLDTRVGDTLKVWLAQIVAWLLSMATSLIPLAQLISIALAIGYTIWRWRRDARKKD
jgi:hypothetical protein